MTRLALLIRSLDYGGAERHLLTLSRALDKERFSVTVLHFYSGGRLEDDLKASGVPLVSLKKTGRWDLLRFSVRLVRELRKVRPDVIHSFLVEPNLLTVFLKPLFPGTRVVWGVRASRVHFEHYDWLSRLNFRLQCFFSRFADLIIFNSERGRAFHLREGFPARKSVVIRNGIDAERFKPDKKAGLRLRAELGIGADATLVGHVGRLDPMKDHQTLLRAAALLCRKRDDVYLLSVGTGAEDYAGELRRLAADVGIADRVIWAGARSDMPAVYSALDLLVSSSFSEGFPNVIGEAMSCGVPCVVTDTGDSALIVGETGTVVEPRNPSALFAAIVSLMEQDPEERGRRARARILENFSVERMAAETERAIRDIAAGETI
ncbi:MAG TPA: glycosyltransferase [Pyrinomonadaceae bacterium]|jgi:glycosyltransferase involved in cell wall biosynthesis